MEHNRIVYEKPYDAEVEYLESTGTQYIDTAIYGSNNSKVEVDLQLLELGVSKAVFGCYSANQASLYMYQAGGNSNGKWQFGFGWNSNCGQTDTNRHLIICENFDLTIDGSLIFSHNQKTFITPHTMLLFNMHNNSGGIYDTIGIRIFSCKLYNGNTLVRDFIPVRRGNVGYMYDKVSGKLFGNKGTGNFILGQDVSNPVPNIRRVFRFNNKRFVMPMPYDSKIEYLESDGNQYIDTEIEATSNLSINIRMANHATAWTNINICGTIALNPMRRHHLAFDRNGTTYWFDNNNYSSYYKPDNDVVFSIIVDAVKKKLTINNYQTTLSSNTFATGNNYYLFARNGVIQYGKIRIYNTKMYNGTLLVRDFIPVRKGNIGYMYDKVSGRLFGNLGTGNFILGNDIN